MNKKLITLPILIFGLAACSQFDPTDSTQQNVLNSAPGQYEHTTVSVNDNGTKTVKEVKSDVDIDKNGNKIAVIKEKTIKDPSAEQIPATVSVTDVNMKEKNGKVVTTYNRENLGNTY